MNGSCLSIDPDGMWYFQGSPPSSSYLNTQENAVCESWVHLYPISEKTGVERPGTLEEKEKSPGTWAGSLEVHPSIPDAGDLGTQQGWVGGSGAYASKIDQSTYGRGEGTSLSEPEDSLRMESLDFPGHWGCVCYVITIG